MAFGDIIQTQTNTAASGTSVTVTLSPTATSGNLLVCVHFTGDVNSTAPSGFTEAVAVTDATNNDQGAMYWKISDGTETTVAPGSGASDEHMATVLEIEGPWETSPVDQTATNDATSEATTSSGTTAATSQADEFAVAGITSRAAQNAVDFANWTNSFIERADIFTLFKHLGVATRLLTATGTYETSADHTSAVAMGMIVTFKKQGVGGGGGLQKSGLLLMGAGR